MSAKYFCDVCSEELHDDEQWRLVRKLGDLTVEVIHTWKGASNSGNICHSCIKNAIRKGKKVSRR